MGTLRTLGSVKSAQYKMINTYSSFMKSPKEIQRQKVEYRFGRARGCFGLGR